MRIKGSPGGEPASGNVPDTSQTDLLVERISKTIADLVIAPINNLTEELKREMAELKKELEGGREGLKPKLREEREEPDGKLEEREESDERLKEEREESGENLKEEREESKMALKKELAKLTRVNLNQVKELRKAEEDANNAGEQVREILRMLCERELAKSIFTVCGCDSQSDRIKFLSDLRTNPEVGKTNLIKKFGEMTNEDFDNFLTVLDTGNQGIMQKGNKLAHEFTIDQAKSYTQHSAFVLFLKFLSKGEGGGAKIHDASQRKLKELKKKEKASE